MYDDYLDDELDSYNDEIEGYNDDLRSLEDITKQRTAQSEKSIKGR